MRALVALLLLTTTARADPGDRWDGVMLAEQVGGAAIGGLLIGSAGFGLAIGIGGADNDDSIGVGALVAIAGVATGVTVGVKLTGDWRGGNGEWVPTAAAAGLGTALTVAAFANTDDWPTAAQIALFTTTMFGPPIIAYHLSSDEKASTEKRVMIPLLGGAF